MKNLFLALIVLVFGSCESIAQAPTDSLEHLYDLKFTPSERELMQKDLAEQREDYLMLHQFSLENSVMPAVQFNPIPLGFEMPSAEAPISIAFATEVEVPQNREELAFYTVSQLATLIQQKKISSVSLTEIYLNRLKRYGDQLHCVVSLTEDLAMAQAKLADEEIAQGFYRGPLHGIPYGVKDLLAVEGYPTTWGAMPYKDQIISETATVVKKLNEAGAVLVAKLSMGALAWGDVWFEDTTRNPWNLNQGSSGSSAGSGSATAAGLVAFSIGTETLGSIVSPSTRCGVTGLRPSYGRVSRFGAMALSWSMDKIGPMCRSALDCALVLDAIQGPDGIDPTLYEVPFSLPQELEISEMKIGYLADYFTPESNNWKNDSTSLEVFRSLGAMLEPVSLPEDLPIQALGIILSAEAAAAFDELTRSDQDSLLVRQNRRAWPNVFRSARFIPAVEYIQANRHRTLLIQQMHQVLREYDAVICPSFGGPQLTITNLTGHPCVVFPNGYNRLKSPTSLSIIGNLFEEGLILYLAEAYQQATSFEEEHPPLFNPKTTAQKP